ncbi:MAG: DUF1848 domain-containing protein [Clostridia bacterium]|nr:DUF1848 domain-containing protein [Clostridia bacterium]
MILNTGCRTDIPAYYSDWFYNRIREGFVCTRNPYHPNQVIRYRLDPKVVDILCFCTKNPAPMLPRLSELDDFRQFWFVTVTPYGREIEPFVPDCGKVMQSVSQLSEKVGAKAVGWRYDPIFITEKYSMDFHIKSFERMASTMAGKVSFCVISFIDLYEKTKRNFPSVRAVSTLEQAALMEAFVKIGMRYGIPIRTCCENAALAEFGADVSGCMTKAVLEKAADCRLRVPRSKKSTRSQCNCLLGADIGMYNTCPHGCIYCYANYDRKTVERNIRRHDPASPFLIGGAQPGDTVIEARQESYIDRQLTLFE